MASLSTITGWLAEALGLPFGIKVQNPKPLNAWEGPYDSVADAVATVPGGVRYQGMPVVVIASGQATVYRWKAGTADNQLIPDGGGAAAFTPISENQYGTHPAFSDQHTLNVWLLQHSGSGSSPAPAPSDLSVNSVREADWTPAAGTTYADYEYEFVPYPPPAPTDLTVSSAREAAFTPAAGTSYTDYEYQVL